MNEQYQDNIDTDQSKCSITTATVRTDRQTDDSRLTTDNSWAYYIYIVMHPQRYQFVTLLSKVYINSNSAYTEINSVKSGLHPNRYCFEKTVIAYR